MVKRTNQYDLAILGAGIGGSTLATIVAKHGYKVLLLDADIHPRFVLGESTVRHTLRLVKIMAERFDIPELRLVSSGDNIHQYVTASCGRKTNFGFIYHRPGKPQNPSEANQLVIPPFREGYEAHLFRQDIDAFLYQAALHYGAIGRQKTRVADVEIDQDGVTMRTESGETFTARFLVDAGGFRSPLSAKFGLRDNPTRCKTHSRTLFTHLIDLKDYDQLMNNAHGQPEKWYSGTCHHIFDGGWMWVIPFNNRPGATNPLVSIGWQFDSRQFPKPKDMTPQQEWDWSMEYLPSVGIQFKDAKLVRPWISTDRIQYSSTQTIGYRWALLAQASGNIDALFSRGLANTMEAINAMAPRLMQALKEDDFAPERLNYVEQLQQNNLTHNDMLVHGAYVSFRDYDMWNAWFRVWALAVGLGDLRLASIYHQYKKSHDPALLPDMEEPMGLFCANHDGLKKLFYDAHGVANAVEQGQMDSKEATRRIFDLIKGADFTSPAIGLANPEQRYINAGTFGAIAKSTIWALTSAPPDMKAHLLGAVFSQTRNKQATPAAPATT